MMEPRNLPMLGSKNTKLWWTEDLQITVSDGFEYKSQANIGGAYDKHFFISKRNEHTYLWKSGKRKLGAVSKSGKPRSATSRDKEFTQPQAEYFASRVAEAVLNSGDHVPLMLFPFPFTEVEGVKEGTLGIVMPFLENAVAHTFDNNSLELLSANDIVTIQQLHVFDYLISNLDTHASTTMRVDGKLIGIDRGQSMRYLSNVLRAKLPGLQLDTLDREKTPIGAPSFYNEFFEKVKSGKIKISFDAVKDLLNRVDNISDDTWKSWTGAYLDAFKNKYLIAMKSSPVGKPGNKTYWKGLTPEEIDTDINDISREMVSRKNRIYGEVISFYKQLKNSSNS